MFRRVFLSVRPVTPNNVSYPFRGLHSSIWLFKAAPSPKSAQLKSLKQKLAKEKAIYKKLKVSVQQAQSKVNQRKKAEKAKQLQAKEKARQTKLLDKAFNTSRKVSPFNMFWKENGGNVLDNANAWRLLAPSEKSVFEDKARDYNNEQAQLYRPKPKLPPNKFASFVKQNFVNDGREVVDIWKDLAQQWKDLSSEEKELYELSEAEKEKYHQELKEWKLERIRLFNEKNGTTLTLPA